MASREGKNDRFLVNECTRNPHTMARLPALLLLLLLQGAKLCRGIDVSCSDAKNAWACNGLNNSDSERCCWCPGSAAAAPGTCLPASSACAAGPQSCDVVGSDPCVQFANSSSCSSCLKQPGCGWCASSSACGSGSVVEPFHSAFCPDSQDNWYAGAGTCPSPNDFYGVPLPPWFSIFLASITLFFGLGMTFVGYKLLKPALILTGVAATGIPAFLFAWNYAPDSSTFSLTAASLSGVFGGVLGGVLCWRLFKVGVFVMGGSLGVIISLLLHLLVFVRFLAAAGNTPLIVAAVLLGLATGALALRFMRVLMILSTSTLGAYAAIRGVSLFIPGSFLAELTLAKRIQAGETLPVAMDGYLGGVGALALLGMLVQFLVTARRTSKGDEKDELELELEESELSIEALTKGARARPRRGSARGKPGGPSLRPAPPPLYLFFTPCRQAEEEKGQEEAKAKDGRPAARVHRGRRRVRRGRVRRRRRVGRRGRRRAGGGAV